MKVKKSFSICLLGGDGIGPEVVNATVEVFEALGCLFSYVTGDIGYGAYLKYGSPLPDKTLTAIQNADAVLMGAVTSPPHIEGYFSPIVKMRKILNLYANVRPIKPLIQKENTPIDMVIIRENTEGLYAGRETVTAEGAEAVRVITRKASERIIRYAFDYARKNKRKKVTLVHKANVLRITDGLFLQIGEEIHKEYEDIIFDNGIADSVALRIAMKPDEFDVIVTTNLFGDILSDLASFHLGGLGVTPSGNIGENIAVFEPVHGSAPKYENQDRANPIACMLAGAMMLEYLGLFDTSEKLKKTITATLNDGIKTKDLGGRIGTKEFTREVITRIAHAKD